MSEMMNTRTLEAMRTQAQSLRAGPGRECVFDFAEQRLELGQMSVERGGHRGLLDPIEAGARVGLFVVIGGEEAVTLQAARGHEQKDSERRLAETHPRDQR